MRSSGSGSGRSRCARRRRGGGRVGGGGSSAAGRGGGAGRRRELRAHRLAVAGERPWLADHAALGVVLLPGTAFLELVLHAGARVGCPVVQELVLEAPLVLAERGAVQVQVVVGEPGEVGERPVAVYARALGADGRGDRVGGGAGEGWVRHASGVAVSEEPPGVGEWVAADGQAAELAGVWPPVGAEAVEIEGVYERLGEMGLGYGPAFQGLRGVWRRGEEVFAEVALVRERAGEAGSTGCTRRCWTARCTPARCRSSAGAGCGCRLRGAGCGWERGVRPLCGCVSRARWTRACRWWRRMVRAADWWCRWARWSRARSQRGSCGGPAAARGIRCSPWIGRRSRSMRPRSWRELCGAGRGGRGRGAGLAGAGVAAVVFGDLTELGRALEQGLGLPGSGAGVTAEGVDGVMDGVPGVARAWSPACWVWCRGGWRTSGWRARGWWW